MLIRQELRLSGGLPSGCLFDVEITTTPFSNSAVNSLLKIIASAMSVTCRQQNMFLLKLYPEGYNVSVALCKYCTPMMLAL